MRRRFRGHLAALTVALIGAGCTTPHHSNALIFGTNTGFGIDIGQSPTGTPTLLVGYRRQEAVFMPLVANVGYDANGTPVPCHVYPGGGSGTPPGGVTTLNQGQSGLRSIPPCFLVGQNGGAIDTYSVLASFGAQFSAEGANPRASGGLAQFFATGLAAQVLAIEGGSSLVATGGAAEASGLVPNSAGIAALYDAPEIVTGATTIVTRTGEVRTALVAYLQDHTTDDQSFAAELVALETAAGHAGLFSQSICAGLGKTECIAQLQSNIGAGRVQLFREEINRGIAERKRERNISP